MKANKEKLEVAFARACATPREVAEKAGMPRPTLNKVIAGRSVSPKTLGLVCCALGVDVVEIMEDKSNDKHSSTIPENRRGQ